MPKTISEREAKEIEKYDYIRAELFEKGRKPYTSEPLTKYEREFIRYLEGITSGQTSFTTNNAKSYSDVPTSTLNQIQEALTQRNTSSIMPEAITYVHKMINATNKNFTMGEVSDFLKSLKNLSEYYENVSIFRMLRRSSKEEDSILSILEESNCYNRNKKNILKRYLGCDPKKYYLDKNDVLFFMRVIFDIFDKAEAELQKRKKFVESKKAHDDEDFEMVTQKIRKFQNEIERLPKDEQLKRVDKLITYYTRFGDRCLNSVARNIVLPSKLGTTLFDDGVMSEDLYAKTISELGKLKERINEKRTFEGDTLYRGVPLKDFLKTIQCGEKEKKDLEKFLKTQTNILGLQVKLPRRKNDIKATLELYLKDKISKDRAILSTSSDKKTAQEFIGDKDGVILKIDVSKYKYGLDIADYSHFKYEKEVLLPPGAKLKLTAINEISINPYCLHHDHLEITIDCQPV